MRALAQGALVAVGLWVVSGTALNLSRHPHWYVRGWDFPRTVVAALALLCAIPYAIFFSRGEWYDLAFLGALALAFAWQVWNIVPYTPLAPKAVERARQPGGDHTFRLVVSNVLMENRQYERWLSVIRAARPDVVLALEVDHGWDAAIAPLAETHPHVVKKVLDNYYGMALYSRLPLHGAEVRFLVQDDIPSIHVEVELEGGERVTLHGVHPRPPEPNSGQDSAPRDGELMTLAKGFARRRRRPTVVAGDLNDVAWSYTTHLFLRESRLLDPRLGRGFYNTFNANSRLFRFPLDHVFHSREFRLGELRVLPHVGSDHFPVLIELSYEPEAAAQQEEPRPSPQDDHAADEMIQKGHEEAGSAAPTRG
jgi:endonuclease/exonuclease/phosphatase (EEP) superfamily protein YafD